MLYRIRYLTFLSQLDLPSDFPNSVEIVSVVQAKTCGVVFDLLFFYSLSIRKAWFALSIKCTHTAATSDHLHCYPPACLSPCFHPHLLWASSTEQPKRSCFVVSQIMCYLLAWTHTFLSSLDHFKWASFLHEQGRCVPTLGLSHLLFSLQGILPPHPSDILITHSPTSFRCSNITVLMKNFLRTLY